MADEFDLKALASPPRTLPRHVRVRLVVNTLTVFGAVVLAVGLAATVRLVLANDMVGAWRLDREAAFTPGRLDGYENLEGDSGDPDYSAVHQFRYRYRTPDGLEREGRSFLNVTPKPDRAIRPDALREIPPCGSLARSAADRDPRAIVPVQYSPGHPESSRIKGLRTGWHEPETAKGWLGFTGLVGLAAVVGGVNSGRRRIRLLARGLPARAVILTCQRSGEDEPRHPFDDFRQQWRNHGEWKVRHRMQQVLRGRFVFGVVGAAVFTAWFAVKVAATLRAGQGPLTDGACWGLACLAACFFAFARSAREGLRIALGPASKIAAREGCLVECTFEFRSSQGRTVLGRDRINFTERTAAGGGELVLYDPARPQDARFLEGLASSLRLSESNAWGIDGPPVLPWLDASALVAVVVVSPLLGWAAWRFLG